MAGVSPKRTNTNIGSSTTALRGSLVPSPVAELHFELGYVHMFKEYEELIKQMEYEMQRCSAEAMRRLLQLSPEMQDFWAPKVDIYETPEELVVRVELAGVRKEAISVTLSADSRILNIKGVRTESHVDKRPRTRYHQLEVYFGPFERDILLPANVPVDRENLKATYRDGFLIVTLPKSGEALISRTVPIETNENHES